MPEPMNLLMNATLKSGGCTLPRRVAAAPMRSRLFSERAKVPGCSSARSRVISTPINALSPSSKRRESSLPYALHLIGSGKWEVGSGKSDHRPPSSEFRVPSSEFRVPSSWRLRLKEVENPKVNLAACAGGHNVNAAVHPHRLRRRPILDDRAVDGPGRRQINGGQ